ncbi:hypothetical protein PVAND_007502 [Polypedilum vanderplanki]|uniref:Uncharacterized protein n=1 Tax=Polypedilum vanderplanki TaxID=319348 RepID=A0A9J6C7I2_POLVA|nr:hypothetical protein PVAND_007502 [Polypedilum vanderplanki]
MDDDGDSWDQIDWDQKITDEKSKKVKTKIVKQSPAELSSIPNYDDNYYEIQNDQMQSNASSSRKPKAKEKMICREEAPFPYKDLCRIRSYGEKEFQKLIFETYGNFEKFIKTHEQNLSDESLVELIKIDVVLLEVPFIYHSQMLLVRLSQIRSFWLQIIDLIEKFFEINCKDPKYMLLIDMKGFFESLESMLVLLATNEFLSCDMMKEVFLLLMETVSNHIKSEYFNIKKFHETLQMVKDISNDVQVFDIFPTIKDLKNESEVLSKNVIKGEYVDVIDYLKVQLPLIKEDFLCQLRSGIKSLDTIYKVLRTERTHDATIFPNIQIKVEWYKLWNMKCPIILIHLKTHKEFFNGQILCFTSSKDFNDLIVATVLTYRKIIDSLDKSAVMIEIKKIENIPNIQSIFNQDLYMIEPNSYFDPYYQVFAALKSLNEYNFPFKNRILKLDHTINSPKYERPQYYDVKGHTLKVDSLKEWKDKEKELGFESMQVDAIYSGISNDFSICVGPPGTGKTFIGLELLKILLYNTNEKILILTQTNNALDKMLIGCLEFTQDIVRLGGQCKSETLQPYVAKKTVPIESKHYFKKLQSRQRDTISKLAETSENNHTIFNEISMHYRLCDEINQLNIYCNVSNKRIYGMTSSFAAHNNCINKMLKPSIIIVEEASELLESHTIVALTKEAKHIIMIGDHHQLRPQTNSYDLRRHFDFNISLFERLIKNKYDCTYLDVQRRMRSEFCDLVRNTIYKHLKDAPNVKCYPDVKGMTTNFFCLNHNHPESSIDTSKENLFEVEFIISLYMKLVTNNSSNDIVILTPYAAQAERFRNEMKRVAKKHSLPQVRVAILDAYQGEESNIILLSLVRSNEKDDIGFLSEENRISVILSRAKIGFYICGNIDSFARASKKWKQIQRTLMEHNVIKNSVPPEWKLIST